MLFAHVRKGPEHPSHPPWLVAEACERPFRGCGKGTSSAIISDMHHVVTNWCIQRHPHEEALLHSVMIRLGSLIVGTALLLSTWQRSLSSSLSIRGAASRFLSNIFDLANMETESDEEKMPLLMVALTPTGSTGKEPSYSFMEWRIPSRASRPLV